MAAKDYEFKANGGPVFLAKKLKDPKKISDDKRQLDESEILGVFTYFYKSYCAANNTTEMVVNLHGKPAYVVKDLPQEPETAPETEVKPAE